ncbi:cysteine--tRNA ligase [Tersicoccus solisilvae]|uniref:Cysteine--tRNA ligase n=1 Tax=Tersicoccus solisilvae TaxID=1882339 RepID=A0ABQ1PNZ8_9MICC|nr:cysteine--tRNA ligase [Tersicoccus solisilvae]GGD00560.1 cysteine--tRNA ligase [Tersicoccus solisilvae]
MTLRLHDSRSASVVPFTPVAPGRASVYYCGATVQSEPHLGHLRSALSFDLLTRWLEATGLAVTVIRNVTDIDDKILANAAASFADDFTGPHPQEPWWGLAYRVEQEFEAAYAAIGVRRPTYEPRATGHITEMHALVRELVQRGHAYPAEDGSGDVYFDVRSWPEYGSLTRQSVDDMQDAADADPRGKRDPRDFALWKGHKEGEPESASWPDPLGRPDLRGRPGWHLECSAMAGKYLGAEFDIHGGGLDLRFPHHENELAQSTAAGHRFARVWMHNGLVTLEGEKMSKSAFHFVTAADVLAGAEPVVVRYFMAATHYRSVLDFRPATPDDGGSLAEAAAAYGRIRTFVRNADRAVPQQPAALPAAVDDSGEAMAAGSASLPAAFTAAMDDDLNIPAALGVVHETVRRGNTALAEGDTEAAAAALANVRAMTGVLGLDPLDPAWSAGGDRSPVEDALDALVAGQLAARAEARGARDFALADGIRERLTAAGIVIEDGKDGSSWALA